MFACCYTRSCYSSLATLLCTHQVSLLCAAGCRVFSTAVWYFSTSGCSLSSTGDSHTQRPQSKQPQQMTTMLSAQSAVSTISSQHNQQSAQSAVSTISSQHSQHSQHNQQSAVSTAQPSAHSTFSSFPLTYPYRRNSASRALVHSTTQNSEADVCIDIRRIYTAQHSTAQHSTDISSAHSLQLWALMSLCARPTQNRWRRPPKWTTPQALSHTSLGTTHMTLDGLALLQPQV